MLLAVVGLLIDPFRLRMVCLAAGGALAGVGGAFLSIESARLLAGLSPVFPDGGGGPAQPTHRTAPRRARGGP